MQIFNVSIDEIKPYEANAKIHTNKQIKQVADSIKRFGFIQAIVIDKNNEIIIGHCRYEASKLLDLKEVPVVKVETLTDEEVKSLRLADNKLNESAWNMKLVIDDLKGLNDELINLSGFDKDLLIEPDAKDDVIPENPPTVAKLGDIWALGRHRLMCGDSTKKEDVDKLMAGQKADMVFTDPPYGVSIGSKNELLDTIQKAGKVKTNIKNDTLLPEALKELLVKAFVLLKENSNDVCSYFVTAPQGGELGMMMMTMKESGLPVRHIIIWVKNRQCFSMGRLDYEYKHEPILYTWNKSHRFYAKGQYKSSVWNIDKEQKCNVHPTMKPVELIVNALLNNSIEDNIVVDIFGGSGSTLIACEKTNRICYMAELDEHYCDVIIKRWEDFTGGKAVKIQ